MRLSLCFFLVGVSLPGQDAWHRAHDLGNRYEGLVDIATGNPRLEILSFTAYLKPFEGPQEWRVRFFTDVSQKVTVYARDVDDLAHYFMESKPLDSPAQQWSEFQKWDTRPVLLKQGVEPTRVGVTIQALNGSYLPAIVYPASTAIPPLIRSYRLQLRVNQTVDHIEYVIEGMNGNGAHLVERRTITGEHTNDLPFALEIDVSNFSAGPLDLVLRLMNRTTIVSSKELKFYHHPLTAR
jgi:hypothetical protein